MQELEVRAKIDPNKSNAIRDKLLGLNFRVVKLGSMEDCMFDHPALELKSKGQKLRIRHYSDCPRAEFCWKGKKEKKNGKKIREELQIRTSEYLTLFSIVKNLGFVVQKIIERKIAVYQMVKFGDTLTFRFEYFDKYPGLVLAEIEGSEKGIDWLVMNLEMENDFGPFTLNSFIKEYLKDAE